MMDSQPLGNGALLTERETEVLNSLLEGNTSKSTASTLGISPKTVETYRARLRAKMRAANTVELIKIALKSGFG